MRSDPTKCCSSSFQPVNSAASRSTTAATVHFCLSDPKLSQGPPHVSPVAPPPNERPSLRFDSRGCSTAAASLRSARCTPQRAASEKKLGGLRGESGESHARTRSAPCVRPRPRGPGGKNAPVCWAVHPNAYTTARARHDGPPILSPASRRRVRIRRPKHLGGILGNTGNWKRNGDTGLRIPTYY